MSTETIILKNLSIGYRTKNNIRTVAEGINAAIRSGELTCLLGANGVGKSTLLRTLSAFQPKLDGEILIAGKEIGTYHDKELSRTIGVVLTEKPDIRNMTVRELVALGRSPYTGFWGTLHNEDWQVVDEAINAVTYFIDDAILVGVSRVRILHGTGTGILRQLIRQYLATIPNVSHFRDEHVQFGGAGITVVDLD